MHGCETQVGGSDAIWQFDPAQMMPGDVVLEHGHGSFSPIIMHVDRGHFSHALIWLGGGDFLEAAGSGVRVISFARVFVRNPSEWILLRHTDPNAGESAARQARSMAHKKYDLWGAVAAKSVLARLDPTRLFCSQLVAAAYEAAGYPLIQGKKPFQVTPNALIRESCLRSVSPAPLIELKLSDDNRRGIADLLDRDRAYEGSKMSEEMRISQEVVALVRPLYPQLDLPADTGLSCPPSNLYEAIVLLRLIDEPTALRISDRMTSELDKRGYFNLLDDDLRAIGTQRLIEKARIHMAQIQGEELERMAYHLTSCAEGRAVARARHGDNASALELLLTERKLTVFSRLQHMHRMIEMQMIVIEKTEQEILAECQKRLASAISPTSP